MEVKDIFIERALKKGAMRTATDSNRRVGSPRSTFLSVGLALLVMLAVTNVASANWPPCRAQCDKNFTKEDLIQHPGLATVCHRGCELFTVALISTPRGGVPLVGAPFGSNGNFNLSPEVAVLLGVAHPGNKSAEQTAKAKNNGTDSKWEIAKKQKKELEQKIVKQMDSIGMVKNDKKIHKLETIKIKDEKKVAQEKINKEKSPMQANIVIEKINNLKNENKKLEQPKAVHEKHKQQTEIVNGPHILNYDMYDCDEQEEIEKLSAGTGTIVKDDDKKNKSEDNKFFVKEVVYSKPSNNKVHEPAVTLTSKVPRAHFATVTGEAARKILEMARSHKIVTPPDSKSPRAMVKTVIDEAKKLPNPSPGSISKTTMQPIPHPVQDHPVQATRQITTDSSDAEERKMTTPKTSNPVAPVSHKIHDLEVISMLGNKLDSAGSKQMLPVLHMNYPRPRPAIVIGLPQQISIIEIVKKKNNIDFEKLHQEHMKDAVHCPMIHERFEQAKQSCRHACATAFKLTDEQDACVVGCQIQAASSANKVILARPPKLEALPLGLRELPFETISRPGGMLSTFRTMFSSLLGNIGQSVYSMWNFVTNKETEKHQKNTGPFASFNKMAATLSDTPQPQAFKAIGEAAPAHLGVHVFYQNIDGPPPPVSRPSPAGGPRGLVTNAEGFFQIFRHGPAKSPPELLQNQIAHHDILQKQFQRQGNLLAGMPNFVNDQNVIPNEINRQFEIMGQHLNEKTINRNDGFPIMFKLLDQLVFNTEQNRNNKLKNSEHQLPESSIAENKINIFEKLFSSRDLVKTLMRHEHSKETTGKDLNLKVDKKKTTPFKDAETLIVNIENAYSDPSTINKADCQTTSATDNSQGQQLDLLDCISRKSGLPRWLIAITVFASALVVFWLCFSLSTPVDEAKLGKAKGTTVVICDNVDDCIESDCSEKKQLLPESEFFNIHLQTV